MDDVQLKVMRLIEATPDITQRDLASKLGVSVGKANYLLKGLISKGLVKAENFRKSQNKIGYLYIFTPEGLEQKARITRRYLQKRVAEYESMKAELEAMRQPLKRSASSVASSTKP